MSKALNRHLMHDMTVIICIIILFKIKLKATIKFWHPTEL